MYNYIPTFDRALVRLENFLEIINDPDLNTTLKEDLRHYVRMLNLQWREGRYNVMVAKLNKAQARYEAEIEAMNLRKEMSDL